MSMINSQEIAVSAIKEIYDLWKVDTDRTQWVGDTSSDVILREGYGFDALARPNLLAVATFLLTALDQKQTGR
jgi:hypothetical protein